MHVYTKSHKEQVGNLQKNYNMAFYKNQDNFEFFKILQV